MTRVGGFSSCVPHATAHCRQVMRPAAVTLSSTPLVHMRCLHGACSGSRGTCRHSAHHSWGATKPTTRLRCMPHGCG